MTETATRHAPGTPCWVSLMVHGLEASQEFYHGLFGWEYRSGPQAGGPFHRAVLDGQEVAGIGAMPADRHFPVAWLPHLAAEDADAAAESVRLCGGTVGVGPLDVERVARVAIASDPSGAAFGIWQAGAYTGVCEGNRPGTAVWHELLTRRVSDVDRFYPAVFGVRTEAAKADEDGEWAGGDLLAVSAGGRAVGGIRGLGDALPRGRGPHWLTYFEVEDPDAAVRRASELGGHVLSGPHDARHGRWAQVADPEGASFAVVRTRPQPAAAG